MSTAETISKILHEKLLIQHLEVINQSHLHVGHEEAKKSGGGHFKIIVVSSDFVGKSLIQRHRMIYSALNNLPSLKIHALAIQALTPTEEK